MPVKSVWTKRADGSYRRTDRVGVFKLDDGVWYTTDRAGRWRRTLSGQLLGYDTAGEAMSAVDLRWPLKTQQRDRRRLPARAGARVTITDILSSFCEEHGFITARDTYRPSAWWIALDSGKRIWFHREEFEVLPVPKKERTAR